MDHRAEKAKDGPQAERNAPPRREPPRRRRLLRWALALLALCALLLLIAIALLPPLLSTDTAREIVLDRVNRRINGRLTIRDWSLGWFSGVALSGVRLDDAEGRPVFEAKAVIVSANIPGLVRAKKRLRTALIDHPRLRLTLGRDGRLHAPDILKPPAEAPTAPGAAAEAGPRRALPPDFDLRSGLIIRNGEIELRPEEGGPPLKARGIELGAQISTLTKPAHFKARFIPGGAESPVLIEGDVTLMAEGARVAGNVEGDVTLRATEFPLAALAPVTLRLARPFAPGGTAEIEAKVRFRGLEEGRTTLRLEARDVTAAPPGGGAEPSRIPRLKLDAAWTWAGRAVRVEEFRLESAMADVDAKADFTLPEAGTEPAGSVSGKLRVDLAALGAFFPHLLDMPEGLTIKGGTLRVEGKVRRGAAESRAQVEAKLERLDLAARGARLLVDKPVTVTLTGERTPRGIHIERFALGSPYGRLTAWGTPEEFECHLFADVTALAGEAARFMELRGGGARGRAEAHLRVTTPQPRTRRGDFSVELKDFELTGLTRRPLEFRGVRLAGTGVAELDAAGQFVAVRDVTATLRAPAVSAVFAAQRVAPGGAGDATPAVRGGRLTVEGDLAQALALAHGSGALPSAIELRGGFRLDSDLEYAGGTLRAERPEMTLGELAFAIMEQRVVEPKIALRARGVEWTPATRGMALREAELDTSWAVTRIEGVRVGDWAAFPRDAAGRARVDLNLDRVKEILRRVDLLPARFDVTGQVQAGVELAPAAGAPRWKLSLVATDLKLLTESEPPVDEKRVSIDLDGLRRDERGLSVDNITVASTFVSLSGKGRLNDATPPEIEAEGSLVVDLDQLGPVLARLLKRPVSMSGRHAGPFQVAGPVAAGGWKPWVRNLRGQAALRADRLGAYGLEGTEIAATVRDDRGLVELALRGKVNGGPLDARLALDARSEPPALRLPEAGPLFTGARLTPAATVEALGRLDPVFADATAPQGTISLSLTELAVPVAEKAREGTVLTGAITFRGVSFAPGALLRQATTLAQRGAVARVQLPDQSAAFSLRGGVLRHEPIALRAGGMTLRVECARRADGALEGAIEVPCTFEMAGRDRALHDRLREESFRLEIGGRVGEAAADVKGFQARLGTRLEAVRAQLARERAAQELDRAVDDLFRQD